MCQSEWQFNSIEGLKVNQKYPENAVDCKIVCCAMPPSLLRNLKCLPTGLDSFQTSRQLRRLVGPFEHLHRLFTNINMNIHASRAVLNHVVACVVTPVQSSSSSSSIIITMIITSSLQMPHSPALWEAVCDPGRKGWESVSCSAPRAPDFDFDQGFC